MPAAALAAVTELNELSLGDPSVGHAHKGAAFTLTSAGLEQIRKGCLKLSSVALGLGQLVK